MANIFYQITVGQIEIMVVDSNPASGLGTVAPIGSIASVSDGSGLYVKHSASNTDWALQASVASEATILPTASLAIVGGGTTNIDAQSKTFSNFFSSSNATATTISYANISDGATVTIDYLKTTASDLVITFPAGSVVSLSSNCVVSGGGLIATLSSTASGRFTISVLNINGVYKVYIVNDVA